MKVFVSYMAVNPNSITSQSWGNFTCNIERLDSRGIKEIQNYCDKLVPQGFRGVVLNVVKLEDSDMDEFVKKLESSL